MKLTYMLEKPEEDRLNELITKIGKENTFFYSAFDFDEKTNIENFCKVFKKNDLESVANLIKLESKLDKTNIIIKNFERIISKDNKETYDFLSNIKDTDVNLFLISKETSQTDELVLDGLKKFGVTIDKSKHKNFFDEKIIKKQDNFIYYSIFGTNERYKKYIDVNKTVKENIINLILKKDSVFRNESEKILKEELRTLQLYNKMLMVIAKGNDTLNEIAKTMDMTTSTCNKYLNVLVSLKILSKNKPLYETDIRQSKYAINNNLLRFYYYFIPDNINELELEKYDDVYNNIEKNYNNYLINTFINISGDYILKLASEGKIKVEIKDEGAWWDKQNSIDIIKGNSLQVVVADCYYNDELVGKKEYEKLKSNAKKLDVADRKYFLFAKKGFSSELKKLAKENNDLTLVTLDEMFDSQEDKGKRLFFFTKKG